MSCRKQHFIFITKVETGISVQNQNISVELYSQVDKMTTFFGCFASIDRDKNPCLSLVSITFCVAHVVWTGVRMSNERAMLQALTNERQDTV